MNKDFAFFHYAEICVSAIGAILLIAIWNNIRDRFQKKLEEDADVRRIDKGLLYLGLAILIWAIKGVVVVVSGDTTTLVYRAAIILFSLVNSLFFVLALYYFDHSPSFLYKNKRSVKVIIWIFILISITSFLLYFLVDSIGNSVIQWSFIPDLLISSILTYLLSFTFYRTFIDRKLRFVAYFSLISLLAMFVSQWPEVLPGINEDNNIVQLLRLTSKSALISLCLVLATTWVIELAETPRPSEMGIRFLDWSHIELSIPSKGIHHVSIDFKGKHTQFRNLLKFAVRRKYAPIGEHFIEVIRDGEIQSAVYLTRIMDDINNCLNEEVADRKDIFTFIGQGKYRIRFLPENIFIDEALLYEFVHDENNTNYLTMIDS